MLSSRINKAEQFREIYKTGSRYERDGLFLFWLPKDQELRFATSVRKKIYKRAVDRNYIRRVVRESVRNHQQLNNLWLIFDFKKRQKLDSSLYHLCNQIIDESGILGNQ